MAKGPGGHTSFLRYCREVSQRNKLAIYTNVTLRLAAAVTRESYRTIIRSRNHSKPSRRYYCIGTGGNLSAGRLDAIPTSPWPGHGNRGISLLAIDLDAVNQGPDTILRTGKGKSGTSWACRISGRPFVACAEAVEPRCSWFGWDLWDLQVLRHVVTSKFCLAKPTKIDRSLFGRPCFSPHYSTAVPSRSLDSV
jgi:hypothetical protein